MKIFQNVAALETASLTAGQIVQTKGYYTAGDGGDGFYLIEGAGTAYDGYVNHQLANNNVATLQTENNTIYVDQAGAVGDGLTDDTAAIQAAINVAFAEANKLDQYINRNKTSPDSPTRIKTGSMNIVFGCRKAYKTTDTLNIQGLPGLDTVDSVDNYYGCNINVDFNGSTIYPAASGGVIPNPVMVLWGARGSHYKRLRIDLREHNSPADVYTQQVVGISITPGLATEISSGGAVGYNNIYEQIEIFGSWRGFELASGLGASYRNQFSHCSVEYCSDAGFYFEGVPAFGDSTTNVFNQCHVKASQDNIGRSNNGINYLPLKTHDPAVVTTAEPGVGADWQEYWAEAITLYAITPYPAWGTDTLYLSTGKGYHFDNCGGISFDGTNSMDGVITGPDKPGFFFNSRFLSISGGFHFEGNYMVADDCPLFVFGGNNSSRGGDVFIDCLFAQTPHYSTPNPSALIKGWSTNPGRSLSINSYVEYVGTGQTSNRLLADITDLGECSFGPGITASLITGTTDSFTYITQNITATRQFKENVANSGTNCIFSPTAKESGTYYRFNADNASYQEMDLSTADVYDNLPDGAYFEMMSVNAAQGSGSYTSRAPISRVVGNVVAGVSSNIFGPTEAINGQTLCIQKHSGGKFITWIKPTNGYNPEQVKSVYGTPLTEHSLAAGLPVASVWQGYQIAVTDASSGYTVCFCDGTNWIDIKTGTTVV